MDVSLMLQFWVVCGLLVLMPGADWAFAIGAGLRAKSIIPSVSGVLAGYAVIIVIIALGVGALAVQFPTALTAITLAGAAYLLYLGVKVLRSAPASAIDPELMAERPTGQFLRGAGVSGFNPKGLILLVALLPQFVSPGGWPTGMQVLALGSLHVMNCAIVYTAVALLARRSLRGRPKATSIVHRISGVALLLFGTVLLVEQIATLAA